MTIFVLHPWFSSEDLSAENEARLSKPILLESLERSLSIYRYHVCHVDNSILGILKWARQLCNRFDSQLTKEILTDALWVSEYECRLCRFF